MSYVYSRRLAGKIEVAGKQIYKDPETRDWMIDQDNGKTINLSTELEVAAYEINDRVRVTIEFEGTPEL